MLLAAFAAGCTGSEACVDFTQEVLVVASRTDDGRGTRIEVELRRAEEGENSIPVKLCDDSTLEFDGEGLVGVKRPSGAVIYEAKVASGTGTEPVVHRLRLENSDGVSEFSGEVDAPGFEISAPVDNTKVSREVDLPVVWEPVHEAGMMTMRLSDAIDGETCLAGAFERDVGDGGMTTIVAGEIALSPDTSRNATCEAYVTLSRRAEVTLTTTRGDVSLHPDSRIEATNSRARRFRSVP